MITWSAPPETPDMVRAGLRFGGRGTHTSRTMMLVELRELFRSLPPETDRNGYLAAIVEDNVLGKATEATRRLTSQRLGELYGLDRGLPLFRARTRARGPSPQ